MADFEFDNPTFNPDDTDGSDDEIRLIHPPGDLLSSQGQVTQRAKVTKVSLQQVLLQTAVDDYYHNMTEEGLTPSFNKTRQNLRWMRRVTMAKGLPEPSCHEVKNRKPLSYPQSTLGAGVKVIREELGFEGWTRPKKTFASHDHGSPSDC